MAGICILGATGTIGLNTLDVIGQHPEQYQVIALTANQNVERLLQLCIKWSPRYAVMVEPDAAEQLAYRLKALNSDVTVLSGVEGLVKVAQLPDVDKVMAAIVGGAGLLPTLAAAQAGKTVLLANKEALVMSGHLFMQAIRDTGATLLPIDSEHNAIFQCMPAQFQQVGDLAQLGVHKILLTASGGPFRKTPLEQLGEVTPEQACAHPNWKMGQKISVDSATMMNKGLEVIEACWLFNTTTDFIDVVLHPQSIIHSLVAYVDGSVLAQLGNPDMRTPIAHALAYPKRISAGVEPLNLIEIARLEFEPIVDGRFPCLQLAYEAMRIGGTATTILNAANEIAVQAFLERRIRFTQIPRLIENTLAHIPAKTVTCLDDVLADDTQARLWATTWLDKLQSPF
ncbi:1-deoxy-D-xylulose 5-phosphate reductoisomerase [Beggiatoa alba B18LD]|uniref:1-deoxy-D-xylulose 5-phosphate reductoisomerase n=1 Tax=Beggiatoa alba B18LD TaxID=395493 RepID=I3CKE1_9GAMM|nr:1-deoxy-D-xylulose-5-phosphate reductoisomerase [Beggiatoa alba]EIJ44084.1 1-deoxy-D-xylulose 5-phosphate reductoisomerase [Beggiatoa alba B18LD]